ncbi:hypothetical protein MASR1M12_10470 [Erysipelotrichia bacterium]
MADIFSKKTIPVLVIDEAHLMREAIWAKFTLLEPAMNEKIMPMILSGHLVLIDKLKYHSANAGIESDGKSPYRRPGSAENDRIPAASPEGSRNKADMLYDEASVLAIHQGSGGILKGELFGKRSLTGRSVEKIETHFGRTRVRLAATELL